ncbi:ATP-dependent Clp protease adaptor protein ClpS [Nonlabens dokdonensis]|uniref:Ribosomal protein L11 methyltransferase n=2 Tax=Nonlabens dokdonensis TaxID=328515 RepID=L7W501_NONDD|nr:ribosomal protein L11 methyltransferase [Nonlabens dokdonensis DSW-6]PZX39082.1 ATP-dependent Clp protease adaptor protein ClpS [Nonlabens dokdonensis]
MKLSTQEQVLPELELEVLEQKENKIVLFNDEVNTFDHVIDMLVAACDHTPIQAEQCSLIVHYKGKCNVKSGDYNDLEPRCTALLEAGLTAEIQ